MAHQENDNDNISVNANSSANAGNSNTDENGVVLSGSHLTTTDEFEKDKNRDDSKEDTSISAWGIDDFKSDSDSAAATDRAGRAERKPYGDTELNKGLEAQAKDEEGA